MFPSSTQKKYWTFSDENDVNKLRQEANANFIERHGAGMTPELQEQYFLTAAEEQLLLRHYELQLRDFCKRFQPPQPRCVLATASHYFKRFYLRCSLMDYHPKEILVTCVYLACKVEEFNVSISQFVANIRGDRDKASGIILASELLLMQQLNYHLTVHSPYRAVEGLLIDIKTRSQLKEPERLRPHIDELLERSLLTDACLLFAPSQLALAAVLHAVSRLQENLDMYVTEVLFGRPGAEKLSSIVEAVRKIRTMVKSVEPLPRETVKALEKKLEKCRNQENNPDSQIYKQRMQEALDEEDEGPSYATLQREASERDIQLLHRLRWQLCPDKPLTCLRDTSVLPTDDDDDASSGENDTDCEDDESIDDCVTNDMNAAFTSRIHSTSVSYTDCVIIRSNTDNTKTDVKNAAVCDFNSQIKSDFFISYSDHCNTSICDTSSNSDTDSVVTRDWDINDSDSDTSNNNNNNNNNIENNKTNKSNLIKYSDSSWSNLKSIVAACQDNAAFDSVLYYKSGFDLNAFVIKSHTTRNKNFHLLAESVSYVFKRCGCMISDLKFFVSHNYDIRGREISNSPVFKLNINTFENVKSLFFAMILLFMSHFVYEYMFSYDEKSGVYKNLIFNYVFNNDYY